MRKWVGLLIFTSIITYICSTQRQLLQLLRPYNGTARVFVQRDYNDLQDDFFPGIPYFPHIFDMRRTNSARNRPLPTVNACQKSIRLENQHPGTVRAGSNVMLECKVVFCEDMGGEVEWYRADVRLNSASKQEQWRDRDTIRATFLIDNVDNHHEDQYSCRFPDGQKSLEANYNLKVLQTTSESKFSLTIALWVMIPIIAALLLYLSYLCYQDRKEALQAMISPDAPGLLARSNREQATHILFNPKPQNIYVPFPTQH